MTSCPRLTVLEYHNIVPPVGACPLHGDSSYQDALQPIPVGLLLLPLVDMTSCWASGPPLKKSLKPGCRGNRTVTSNESMSRIFQQQLSNTHNRTND